MEELERIRLFLIKNSEDCDKVNKFLEGLESKNIEYEVDYDYDLIDDGVLITVDF